MAKIKTGFFCTNCGYESAKWTGKCPACGEWNTFSEELITKDVKDKKQDWKSFTDSRPEHKSILLSEVKANNVPRIISKDNELNRVLGGGIVPGSIVLVAGEPGIGKSTLFLQIGLELSHIKTLYISGEESEQQIKLRATRLNISNNNFYLLTETNTQGIFKEIKKLQPQLLIIDSIQTLVSPYIESSAGSISQIRETAAELQKFAKETNT